MTLLDFLLLGCYIDLESTLFIIFDEASIDLIDLLDFWSVVFFIILLFD